MKTRKVLLVVWLPNPFDEKISKVNSLLLSGDRLGYTSARVEKSEDEHVENII